MIEDTKWTEKRCDICTLAERDQLEKELLDGTLTGKEIAKKYGFTESQLSRHKTKHIMSAGTMKDHLKLMIAKSINSKLIAPENVGELIRLLEFTEKMQDNLYLDGTRRLEQYKQIKMDRFVSALNDPLIFADDKPTIERLAKFIFIEDDGTKDFGDFLKALIG